MLQPVYLFICASMRSFSLGDAAVATRAQAEMRRKYRRGGGRHQHYANAPLSVQTFILCLRADTHTHGPSGCIHAYSERLRSPPVSVHACTTKSLAVAGDHVTADVLDIMTGLAERLNRFASK